MEANNHTKDLFNLTIDEEAKAQLSKSVESFEGDSNLPVVYS